MNTEVVDKMDALFSASRNKYEKLYSKYQMGFVYDHQTELSEFFNDSPSGLRWLLTLFVNWKRRKLLKKEIGLNLKSDEQGYFRFLDNVFGQQYMLIKNFKDALSIYQSDNKRAIDMINALNEGHSLNRNDFLISAQLYYIDVYYLLEVYVSELYFQFTMRLNLNSNDIPASKVVVNKKVQPTFEIVDLNDEQLGKLHRNLVSSAFIDKTTTYKSFKHILLQSNLSDGDLIKWIDIADNKLVNKITILQFVSQIVQGTVKAQNDFIVTFFRQGSDIVDGAITRDALKNSRRRFSVEKLVKNTRIDILKNLIIKAVDK